MAGFRDTLCDTQPVSTLSDSDEVFAVELSVVGAGDQVTAVVVNIDTSCSLRCGLSGHVNIWFLENKTTIDVGQLQPKCCFNIEHGLCLVPQLFYSN